MANMIEFRPANKEDADFVNAHLRNADIREIEALGQGVRGVVWMCVRASDFAWTGLIDGVPAMVLGCAQSPLAEEGEVWALGTNELDRHPREVLIYGKQKLAEMLDVFPCLGNYCGAWHTKNLKWLRKLGFEIGAPSPCGEKGLPFCKITVRKKEGETCV